MFLYNFVVLLFLLSYNKPQLGTISSSVLGRSPTFLSGCFLIKDFLEQKHNMPLKHSLEKENVLNFRDTKRKPHCTYERQIHSQKCTFFSAVTTSFSGFYFISLASNTGQRCCIVAVGDVFAKPWRQSYRTHLTSCHLSLLEGHTLTPAHLVTPPCPLPSSLGYTGYSRMTITVLAAKILLSKQE